MQVSYGEFLTEPLRLCRSSALEREGNLYINTVVQVIDS